MANDCSAARAEAYHAIAAITLEGMQVRRDIGLSAGSPSTISLERNPLHAPAPAPAHAHAHEHARAHARATPTTRAKN